MTQLPESQPVLNLSDLQEGLQAITPAFGAALVEAGAICLSEQGYRPGVALEVEGSFSGGFVLLWPKVTDQMRRCWNDQDYTTEQGAYGAALLLIQRLTSFTVVERSRRGTGFDYWLGNCPIPLTCPLRSLLGWRCLVFVGAIPLRGQFLNSGKFAPKLP